MEKHALFEETIVNFLVILSKHDNRDIFETINTILLEIQNDFSLFSFLLKTKRCLLSKSIGVPINFPIDAFINELKNIQLQDEKFQIALEAIENMLAISMKPELVVEILLNEFDATKQNFETSQDENKIISIYQTILETSFTLKLRLTEETISKFTQLIPQWATSSDSSIYSITCYKIIPRYLQVTDNYAIYADIFKQIQLTSTYHTICCLIPSFKNMKPSNLSDILHQKWFWNLIQKGLTANNMTCKSALFILKESINLLTEETISFDKLKAVAIIQNTNDLSFSGLKSDWKNFIILFEILDETQSHLILPALHLLDSVKYLNYKWVAIIYSKLLKHNSQSVQQFGIQKIFEMNYENSYNQNLFFEISEDLALFLNRTSLYCNASTNTIPIFTQKLIPFFDLLNKSSLLTELLNKCIQIDRNKWLSVPLFNICYSLSKSNYKLQEDNSILVFENLIKISESILNVFLRSSSQFLLLNFLLEQKVELIKNTKILLIMDTLFSNCKVKRNDSTWNNFIIWCHNYSDEICELTSLPGRMILLLFDSKVIKKRNVEQFFNDIFVDFTDIAIRYNVDQHHLDAQIDKLLNVLIFLDGTDCDFNIYGNNIFSYTIRIISELYDLNESGVIEKYSTIINLLLPQIDITKIVNFVEKNIKAENTSVFLKYYSLRLLTMLFKKGIHIEVLSDTISNVSHHYNMSSIINSSDCKAIPKHLITEFYNTLNYIKISYLHLFPENSSQLYESNSDYLDEVVQFGGKKTITSTLRLTQLLFDIIAEKFDKHAITLLKMNWNNLLDVKRSELFWSGFRIFVEIILSSVIVTQINIFKESVTLYLNKILELGQNMRGLTVIVYDQLQYLWLEKKLNPTNIDIFIGVIIEGVLFGPSKRKDEKIESNMSQVIENLQNNYIFSSVENKYKLDSLARVQAIQLLVQFTNDPHFSSVVKKFFSRLLDRYNRENKNRYFARSQLHYAKNRILQICLLIQPKLSPEDNVILYKWLCTIIMKESLQTSVRYLIEWLFVRVLLQSDELLKDFYSKLNTLGEKRPSSLISIISILYQIGKENENQRKKIISIVLPYTIGSNFKIRLYAQWTFIKIYELTEKSRNVNINEYDAVYNFFKETLSNTNTEKNLIRLQNDFFFNVFDIKNNFTLETIFDILPQLSLIPEEILPIGLFKIQCVYLRNHNTDLRDSLQSLIDTQDTEDNFDADQTEIIQKKITPWNTVIPDSELFNRNNQIAAKKTELIVIASLITKSTNLGGLARTCEIFGVSEYVISNSNILKDSEFQSLSVSAENWLKISTINSSQLIDYLISLKSNGYTIVGCEQTSNSVQLQEYNYPEKTAILFGNEKEGIPSNILAFVDVCVEIPQIGIIRSLNVHVSGALSIWEYNRQHYFEKNMVSI